MEHTETGQCRIHYGITVDENNTYFLMLSKKKIKECVLRSAVCPTPNHEVSERSNNKNVEIHSHPAFKTYIAHAYYSRPGCTLSSFTFPEFESKLQCLVSIQ